MILSYLGLWLESVITLGLRKIFTWVVFLWRGKQKILIRIRLLRHKAFRSFFHHLLLFSLRLILSTLLLNQYRLLHLLLLPLNKQMLLKLIIVHNHLLLSLNLLLLLLLRYYILWLLNGYNLLILRLLNKLLRLLKLLIICLLRHINRCVYYILLRLNELLSSFFLFCLLKFLF